MFNFKQIGWVVLLIVFGSVVLIFAADTTIKAIGTIQAKAASDRQENIEKMAKLVRYDGCMSEKYPTMRHILANVWVDTRNGDKYNLNETAQDTVCRFRIYGTVK